MLTNKPILFCAALGFLFFVLIWTSEYLKSRRQRALAACVVLDIRIAQGNLHIVRSVEADVVSVRGAKSDSIRAKKGACRVEAATLDEMWVTVVVPRHVKLRHLKMPPGATVRNS